MKRHYTLLTLILFFTIEGHGQSTAQKVYDIFQTSCTFSSCHSNAGGALGLDLEGSGPNAMMEVYNNIVDAVPNTVHASNENNMLIKPGDPSRSFLFRKINNGLDPTLSLHPSEGQSMPISGGNLDEEDIELVRQWILHGAPSTGEVIDVSLIDDFYNNNGVQSVSNPPAAPDPSEGFQLHLGPFFVPAGGEQEIFIKHDLMLEEDIEVVGVETTMGPQSHHLIINKFLPENASICGISLGNDGPDSFVEGYRPVNNSSHFSALFQVGAQASENLDLPYKTAFFWEEGTVLDLNSHYINANPTKVLAAEVYVNVYTQASGIALQEMRSLMIPNTEINLPPDNQEKTLAQNYPMFTCFPNGGYLWSVSSHTHELGTDFDIFKSDFGSNNIEHIFDASCFEDGAPDCSTEFYDYQHPPTRTYDGYYPLASSDWLKMEAKYINDTGNPVSFGLTSQDEMMIMFLFFVDDINGIINQPPNAVDDESMGDAGTPINIEVLENDSDDDNLVLTGIAQQPSNGSVTINNDGSITYIANADFSGTDQFSYIVCDDVNQPLCDTATVEVEVIGVSGIFDSNFKLTRAYPNPTNGLVRVANTGNEIRNIQLLSIQGQVIATPNFERTSNSIAVDLAATQLPAGVYWMVVINEDDSRSIAKIVYTEY